MLQYKATLTAIHDYLNPIISIGKLTQQWIVDSYLQGEANNLNFIKMNQKQLRTEQSLPDHTDNIAQNVGVQTGIPVILSFIFRCAHN